MRTWLLRILLLIGVCAVVLSALWLLLNWEPVKEFGTHATSVTSIFLTLFGLVGILLVLYAIYHLIRYLPRSHQFVIEAINDTPGDPSSPSSSSASLLTQSGNVPLDLSELAREELVSQLQLLHDAFENFVQHQLPTTSPSLPERLVTKLPGGDAVIHASAATGRAARAGQQALQASLPGPPTASPAMVGHQATDAGADHLLTGVCAGEPTLYELRRIYHDPDYPREAPLAKIRQCVPSFGPPRQAHGLAHTFAADVQRHGQLYTTITTHRATNLLQSIIEFTPDTYAPASKLLQVILPPRITYITGHLQYDSGPSPRIGITFEFTGMQAHEVLARRTIWRPAPALILLDPAKKNPQPDSASASLTLARGYMTLLEPALRWLAIAIWEHQMTTHAPHRIFRPHARTHYQAEIQYFFSGLYRASIDDFPDDEDLFCTLAVDHLIAATKKEASWFLPYVLLGNMFRRKAYNLRQDHQEAEACVLDQKVHYLFDKAIQLAADEEDDIRNRITGYQAKAYLLANDVTQARRLLKELQHRDLPAAFDADLESAATYLYNVACCYALLAATSRDGINEKDREASFRYLVYSLICNYDRYLWHDAETDPDLQCVRDRWNLANLQKQLMDNQIERESVLDLFPGPWRYGHTWASDLTLNKEWDVFKQQRDSFVKALKCLADKVIEPGKIT